jgi:hypothetical protein
MSRFERYRLSGGAGGLVDGGHTTGGRPTTASNIIAGGALISKSVVAASRVMDYQPYAVEGTVRNQTFSEGDELYRGYSDVSRRTGIWAFIEKPTSPLQAIRKGALPPGNNADFISKITFSGPVEGEVSRIAPKFGMPGGYTQVKLPQSPFVQYSSVNTLWNIPIIPLNFFYQFIRSWN